MEDIKTYKGYLEILQAFEKDQFPDYQKVLEILSIIPEDILVDNNIDRGNIQSRCEQYALLSASLGTNKIPSFLENNGGSEVWFPKGYYEEA